MIEKNGDHIVSDFKITLDKNGKVLSNTIWAQDSTQLVTTDGICMD